MEIEPIKKKNGWWKTIGLFFLIYLVGGLLLQIFLLRIGGKDNYASIVSFVVALIISAYYKTKEE